MGDTSWLSYISEVEHFFGLVKTYIKLGPFTDHI